MKPLNVVDSPSLDIYALICRDLPTDERRQYEALNGSKYDADELAAVMMLINGPKWAIVTADTAEPLAAGGYTLQSGGVWRSWMLARNVCWEKYAEEVTNICTGIMEMMFADFNAHRLETVCLADRTRARRWYERHLGLQCEGIMRAAGVEKEDVALYAITRG